MRFQILNAPNHIRDMTSASRMLIAAYRRAEDAQVHLDFAKEQEFISATQLQILEPEWASFDRLGTTSILAGLSRTIYASGSGQEKIHHQKSVAEFEALVREINASGYKAVCQDKHGHPCLPYVVKAGLETGKTSSCFNANGSMSG